MRNQPQTYWSGNEVAEYDRKQRLLIPRKDELLQTVVDFIPFGTDEPLEVVDVGAGPGALTARVLERFPEARVTLLDSSEEMLALAERRLSDHRPRVAFRVVDINAETWHADLGAPHAIVSSIALHFLKTERRRPFFETACRSLRGGGCLVNAGAFGSTNPRIQRELERQKIEYRRQMLLKTEGRSISTEQLIEMDGAKAADAGVNLCTFPDQLRLLEEAGFESVEIVWRYLALAVFVAHKERG